MLQLLFNNSHRGQFLALHLCGQNLREQNIPRIQTDLGETSRRKICSDQLAFLKDTKTTLVKKN